MALVYAATLAPGLTFWDAGEFQSAVASLGIPHPPGAPLYVLVARVWTRLWPSAWFSVSMNVLSALASAVAGGTVASLFARWTRSSWAGVAAGLAAGLAFSVWQNATETEVYALSLLAGVLLVAVGERAGDTSGRGWDRLLAYLLGLAGVLHLDALLAAPAAVLLVTSGAGARELQLRALARWAPPVLMALGLAQASASTIATAIALAAVLALLPLPGPRRREDAVRLLLVTLGASCALYLLLRAGHDPGVNQGNPSTWERFAGVLARDQYAVPGLWPRRAPLWLQAANLVQYLDWQFAFGLDSRSAFSPLRAAITAGCLALAGAGARDHWRRDARTARAWLVFILASSIGAMLVLNLEAGPSIGWGILPADAGHEARERDYFFVGAFAGIAAWSAMGMAALARRAGSRGERFAPLGIAVLLLAGNAAAANRRREPDARLPAALADALFASAPPNAVLLLAGDNDTYAVWHGQRVRGLRRDLVPVTLPLLGADWYRAELSRRHRLLADDYVDHWRGEAATLRALRNGAESVRRPLAAAMSVNAEARRDLAPGWSARGLVLIADTAGTGLGITAEHEEIARLIDAGAGDSTAHGATSRYVQRLLRCPRALGSGAPDSLRIASLDSACNLR